MLAGGTLLTKLPVSQTPGCAVCTYRSQVICEAFKQVRDRAMSAGMAKVDAESAVNRLCDAITDDARLGSLVNPLTARFAPTEVRAFLQDVNQRIGSQALDGNLAKLTQALLGAWLTMTQAANPGTAFARDFALLTQIQAIQGDAGQQDSFNYGTMGSLAEFLTAYAVVSPCNTCPTPGSGSYASLFPKLDEILRNTLKGYRTHAGKPDFTSSFYAGEAFAKGSVSKQDGGQHMLKYLADHAYTDGAVWIDRKFSYISSQAANPNKEFDVYLGNNPATPVWFVECKSVGEESPVDVDQFLSYVSLIDNFSRLRYVFNARKTGLEEVRQKMRSVLLGSRRDEVFDTIWNNAPLRTNTFPNRQNTPQGRADAQNDFTIWARSLSDNLFVFVEVN